MRHHALLLASLLATLTGCSGSADGTAQLVSVRSEPAGAACTVARGTAVLGIVDPTPGALPVGASDQDLTVTCQKPGWQPATGTVKAGYRGIGFGQLITGGAAAVVEDAVKRTDFRYDASGALVTLTPR